MGDKTLYVDKYKPKNLGEVISNNIAIAKLKAFVVRKPKKTALLLYGPSGSGKTCSVYALANELNLEIVEINASDQRNKDQIASVVRNAAIQRSLFSEGRIILVDEIDGLSGNNDRGGVQELARVIAESNVPMILTANDPWIDKLNSLRQKCEMVEFNKIDHVSILKLLKAICSKEGLQADEESLVSLARRVDGDLRAAINDLQTLMEHGIIDLESSGKRERKESIFNILKAILASKDAEKIFYVMDNSDVDYNELFLWLDENLPASYKNKDDLARAYEILSRADVYRGRITRQQYWRLLVYVNTLLNFGVAMSKENKIDGFAKYKRTTRILKIWKAKSKYTRKKDVAEKFAKASHMSLKRAVKDFDYIKIIAKDKIIASELELTKEEIAAL